MVERTSELGHSMTEWSVGLQAAGLAEIAGQIDQPKLESLQQLTALGLPQNRTLLVGDVGGFLAEPKPYFETLNARRYFAVLSPHQETQQRYRAQRLTKRGVPGFVEARLSPAEYKNYDLILEESFRHRYGGTILCDAAGTLEVHMVAGALGSNMLVAHQALPEFTAGRDVDSGRFSYSFEDPALRQALWRTILSIPHDAPEDGRSPDYRAANLRFTPGYYEFYLSEKELALHGGPRLRRWLGEVLLRRDKHLQPVFIDYSAKPAFRPGRVRGVDGVERVPSIAGMERENLAVLAARAEREAQRPPA